jgi:flagellin FlaB
MECKGMVNTMNKRNTPYMNDDKASIGIGAMIVFIALILVAAVASTIIIKTAEELQQRAEATGDDTRDEISGKIQLIMAYVSEETGGGATTADEIRLVVQMAAGSDATLLTDIQWLIVCDDGAGSAEINTGAAETTGVGGAVNAFQLDGVTALTAGSSVGAGTTFTLNIDTSGDCTPDVGDSQELRIIVDGGGETYAQLTYNDFQAGTLIV